MLRLALTEFTAFHQIDMSVGVQFCFQKEGLVFERSESKTATLCGKLHEVRKFFKKQAKHCFNAHANKDFPARVVFKASVSLPIA